MTSEHEFETLLRSWLDESAQTPAHPDRALASALSETARTRPRPAWLVRLGGEPMGDGSRAGLHRIVPIGLAAATILVAVAIGVGFILRPDRNIGPSPAPRQSVRPSPTSNATPIPRPASWTVTGSMTTIRAYHTATLLRNGQVLVVGGSEEDCCGNPGMLASAELYDPSTGTWSATGPLTTPHQFHTATRLNNGKVLVAGGGDGLNGMGVIASAELYDPNTGAWSATGPLIMGRANPTATLLADGRVLLVGGYGPGAGANGFLASAELYDPNTGTWSATASMSVGRTGHSAALLADGRVLVAGGDGGDGPQASAEVYDPSTGTWSLTQSMEQPRWSFTATVLADGRVLVAGGESSSSHIVSSAELYDPNTGTWSATGGMGTPRDAHRAVLLADGRVVVVGGSELSARSSAPLSAEVYDPTSGRWQAIGAAGIPRGFPTATLLADGEVLLVGGLWDGRPLAVAELLDLGSGS
jgi:hypothetical protein